MYLSYCLVIGRIVSDLSDRAMPIDWNIINYIIYILFIFYFIFLSIFRIHLYLLLVDHSLVH